MKNHYKKHKVKFCPLCGSNVVTHLGNGVFVCGTGDAEIEAKEKASRINMRCNRTFSVVQPLVEGRQWQQMNVQHRKEIGAKLDQLYGRRGNEGLVLVGDGGGDCGDGDVGDCGRIVQAGATNSVMED